MTIRVDNRALERDLEEFFRKRVRMLGGYAFKWVPTIAGVPDRMALFPGGVVIFVELKREGETTSDVQDVWHDRLRKMGHPVVVLHGRQEILDWLRDMVNTLEKADRRNQRRTPR